MMKEPGRCNSSITRVRPVFRSLLRRDPAGRDWLSKVLSLAGKDSPPAAEMAGDPGDLLGRMLVKREYRDGVLSRGPYNIPVIELERCFEKNIPPPRRFLEWLVENPGGMNWPRDGRGNPVRFGEGTQRKREMLFGYHGRKVQIEVQREARASIRDKGAAGSRKKWWAFEGFTKIDCCLETDKIVLLIEGKRAEDVSVSIEWYEGRNQIIRNLEAGAQLYGDKKFGVLVIAEETIDITREEVIRSLPHLTPAERAGLMEHFLGCVLWEEVCEATGLDFAALPETILGSDLAF